MKKINLNYSNIVFFLKFCFPLIAILLLIILFFISPSENFGDSVSVSTENLEYDISFQVNKSKLKGLTDEGYKFDFTALNIEPASNSKILFENLSGKITLKNGNFFNLSGQMATFYSKEQRLKFSGNLKLNTHDDITVKSEELILDFLNKELTTDKKVFLKTPIGDVSGNKMFVKIDSLNKFENTLISISDDVKMSFRIID